MIRFYIFLLSLIFYTAPVFASYAISPRDEMLANSDVAYVGEFWIEDAKVVFRVEEVLKGDADVDKLRITKETQIGGILDFGEWRGRETEDLPRIFGEYELLETPVIVVGFNNDGVFRSYYHIWGVWEPDSEIGPQEMRGWSLQQLVEWTKETIAEQSQLSKASQPNTVERDSTNGPLSKDAGVLDENGDSQNYGGKPSVAENPQTDLNASVWFLVLGVLVVTGVIYFFVRSSKKAR